MQTTLNKFLSYRKSDWMAGEQQIQFTQERLQHLIDISDAIKHFERKYQRNVEGAITYSYFPQIQSMHRHRADIAKRASLRLRQTFNHLISEIQL